MENGKSSKHKSDHDCQEETTYYPGKHIFNFGLWQMTIVKKSNSGLSLFFLVEQNAVLVNQNQWHTSGKFICLLETLDTVFAACWSRLGETLSGLSLHLHCSPSLTCPDKTLVQLVAPKAFTMQECNVQRVRIYLICVFPWRIKLMSVFQHSQKTSMNPFLSLSKCL